MSEETNNQSINKYKKFFKILPYIVIVILLIIISNLNSSNKVNVTPNNTYANNIPEDPNKIQDEIKFTYKGFKKHEVDGVYLILEIYNGTPYNLGFGENCWAFFYDSMSGLCIKDEIKSVNSKSKKDIELWLVPNGYNLGVYESEITDVKIKDKIKKLYVDFFHVRVNTESYIWKNEKEYQIY